MAPRGKAAAGKAAQRVRDAEATFYAAHEELVGWEDAHEDLMSEFRTRVDARETAREVLELAVSDTGLPGGGMQVVPVKKRTFNGERLHYLIEDEELRNRLVQLQYKVITKEFDKALDTGELDKDLAKQAVEKTEAGLQIRKRPNKITLG